MISVIITLMVRVNLALDDEAKAVLDDYKKKNRCTSLDAAGNALLKEFKKMKEQKS